ncbi:gag-polypeptide of LTR copia-type [Sesbania bispinosa]|nr:gag-polypeptide of LTR copia-type [Sesbania bispinosa]
MTPSLHSRMVGCNHAFEIWKFLHQYFESNTRARITQLKSELKGIKKTDSLKNYLLNIKKIVDTLASVGSPIDSSKHIQIILDGLPNEYNPLVASIISHTDPYSITEIETLLTSMENRLEKQKMEEQDLHNVQANYVQYQGNFRGKNQGNYRGRGTNNFRGRGQGTFRGHLAARSQGRATNRNYNRTFCQDCTNLVTLPYTATTDSILCIKTLRDPRILITLIISIKL